MVSCSHTGCILVLGYIVRGPLGGLVWHHLQYVLGLQQLGYDVYFLEDSEDYPACYDPVRDVLDSDPTYGLQFIAQVFERFGLGDRWAYYNAHKLEWIGPCSERVADLCHRADLLLNLSGMNPLRPWFLEVPKRVFIDTDPVFTQIRHLTEPAARQLASQHTDFFSFGENIATGTSNVPDDGIRWKPTRQPIVLSAWQPTLGEANGKFTTVMQWDSYRIRDYQGVCYGMKSMSFDPYLNLPKQTDYEFELAIGSTSAPLAMLREQGWAVRDSREPTRDPWVYQEYIRQSKAEFSVAKHGYVVSRSGWFSERSAAYLASGRPVITQETGFSDWLPVGKGILSFQNLEQAQTAIADVCDRYEFHCQQASLIVEEYFDASDTLSNLLRLIN